MILKYIMISRPLPRKMQKWDCRSMLAFFHLYMQHLVNNNHMRKEKKDRELRQWY